MFKLLVIRFIVKLYFRAEIDFQKQKIYFQYQPKARFLPQDKHTRIHTRHHQSLDMLLICEF